MNGIVYYNYCCEEHKKLLKQQYARVAQLVERDLAKVEAAGSSPVSLSENRLMIQAVFLCANLDCFEVGGFSGVSILRRDRHVLGRRPV